MQRLIFVLIAMFVVFNLSAQVVPLNVTGVCVTNGNPNSSTALEDINSLDQCSMVKDTTSSKVYSYNNAGTAGVDQWVLISEKNDIFSYDYIVIQSTGSTVSMIGTPNLTYKPSVIRSLPQTVNNTGSDITITGSTVTANYRPFEVGELIWIKYISQ